MDHLLPYYLSCILPAPWGGWGRGAFPRFFNVAFKPCTSPRLSIFRSVTSFAPNTCPALALWHRTVIPSLRARSEVE